MQTSLVWSQLAEALAAPPGQRLHLWAWIRQKLDLAQSRPQALPGVVISRLAGREGDYYVIKSPATHSYLRLSERDHFLWQRMDGTRTVKDLVVAYFTQYGSFAFGRVASLAAGLKAGGFLVEQPVAVYSHLREQVAARRPATRVNRFWQAFMQRQFAIRGLDRLFGAVYRHGGALLFTRPAQVLYLLLTVVGLVLFVAITRSGGYGILTTADSVLLGVFSLVIVNLVAIFLHELAHALAVKHYGREVRRAGFMTYFGLPAFFVDTTDIWLENKRARLVVSWAGPYSGLILAGLASLLIALQPDSPLNAFLYKFAFLAYLSVFINLNPLLELDGYYLLMDWLEIPMLRRRSLNFIRSELPARVLAGGKAGREGGRVGPVLPMVRAFSREERVFTVFGLLSVLWTAYAIFVGASFWQQRLATSLDDLGKVGDDLGRLILALAAIAISLPFLLAIGLYLLSLGGRALAWVRGRHLLESNWRVAALLLAGSVALALAPTWLDMPTLGLALGLLALALATALAWRNARDFAGSRLERAFRLLGFFALGLLLREGVLAADRFLLLSPETAAMVASLLYLAASFALLPAGLLLFGRAEHSRPTPLEWLLVGIGLAASCGLGAWLAWNRTVEDLPAVLVPLLALVLLVPTPFAYWHTGFGAAWALLALSLGGAAALALLNLPPLGVYLLLASCFGLHRLAYRRLDRRAGHPDSWQPSSDQARLQRAFATTVAGLCDQLREIAGGQQAGKALLRFNQLAHAAAWQISVTGGRVEESLPDDLSLIDRGRAYAAPLSLLLDLMEQEAGEPLTMRAFQVAYDGLPWEDRELAGHYLFPLVPRAQSAAWERQDAERGRAGLLRRMPLFSTVSDGEIALLASRLREERVKPGQVIIRQGDPGDRFYIVSRGQVEVSERDEEGESRAVNLLGAGDYFGELALLSSAPRSATCRAVLPTELLSLSGRDFAGLVKDRFALREKVDRLIARAELLRRVPLFAEMDGLQVQQVAAVMQEESCQAGDLILRQGDAGDHFYLVEAGQVQVFVRENGRERVLRQSGPGEYFGEIALLAKVPRTASVRALTATRLLVLPRDDFEHLVAGQLALVRNLELESGRRLIHSQRTAANAA